MHKTLRYNICGLFMNIMADIYSLYIDDFHYLNKTGHGNNQTNKSLI